MKINTNNYSISSKASLKPAEKVFKLSENVNLHLDTAPDSIQVLLGKKVKNGREKVLGGAGISNSKGLSHKEVVGFCQNIVRDLEKTFSDSYSFITEFIESQLK